MNPPTPENDATKEIADMLWGKHPANIREMPPGVAIAHVQDREQIEAAKPGKRVIYFDNEGWGREPSVEEVKQQHRTLLIAIAWGIGIMFALVALFH